MKANQPLVGVIADRRVVGIHPMHMAGEKYLRAVVDGASAWPVILPALSDGFDGVDILDRLDGLFLTGSPSNVEPHHYLGEPSRPGTWHDPERDITALALIPAAIRAGMPLFAVCRGFQEVNVAFGGKLYQHVHEVAGYQMHKENPDDPLDLQYAPVHAVEFAENGLLQQITGQKKARVNSVHSQAVAVLGEGLLAEAWAEDGLIEAFRVKGAPGFTLAVQWHPEWKVTQSPVSMAIFKAFGDACCAYRDRGQEARIATRAFA